MAEPDVGLKESGHPGTLLAQGCLLGHWVRAYSGLGITSGAGAAELASDALYQATTLKTLYRMVPRLLQRTSLQEL